MVDRKGGDRRAVGQFVELATHVRPAEGKDPITAATSERSITAIGIDLQDTCKSFEMCLGSFGLTIGGIDIGDHRSIAVAPGSIIEDIGQ